LYFYYAYSKIIKIIKKQKQSEQTLNEKSEVKSYNNNKVNNNKIIKN